MAKLDKNFFTFIKGLNTEVSPLNFPDQTALELSNFELLISGALRRRRGNHAEEGGGSPDLGSVPIPANAFAKFTWHTVGGNPSLILNVIQHGAILHFYTDSSILSNNKRAFTLDLTAYQTEDAINTVPCTFSEGRTKLFVANRYMDSIYIDYDPDTDTIAATRIEPLFRDFEDVVDDIAIDQQPTETEMPTITDTHFFNLKIRGWKTPDINQYFNDAVGPAGAKQWPAKNMIWHQGYKKVAPGGLNLGNSDLASDSWFKEWDSTKLEQELFSNSSAPRGSLFLNPYDTTSLTGGTAANTLLSIQTWTAATYLSPTWFLTITTVDPHTRVPGDIIDITGTGFRWSNGGGSQIHSGTIDVKGAVCGGGTAGNTIYITIDNPEPTFGFFAGGGQYVNLGYVNTTSIINPDPYITTERASACAYWAGRIFLSGMNHPSLSDLILFSQVAVSVDRYNKMYQDRDPTSPTLSELLPDDGGVIQIPGMGTCKAMVPLGNSLIVFGSTGIWEISGGQNYFAADGYGVRKLTDVEVLSPIGICKTDVGLVFTSPRGIYALAGDGQTANLTAQSMTETSIQTLWNNIPDACKERAQVVYDDSLKRVKVLFSYVDRESLPYAYDQELIYDLRLGAWFPYTYPLDAEYKWITGFMTTDASDNSNDNRKTKYFVFTNDSVFLDICDMNRDENDTSTKYNDFDDNELIPYIVTGYDNIGDFHTKRQAPYIHVFMKRTENGFYEDGLDLIVRNPSSLTMQGRFDWSDNSASGKWGTAQQVYRIRKLYIPVDVDDEYLNGEPVVVSKVKVRGSGRAIHLKFTGALGYDAHILGWSILYRSTRDGTNAANADRG